MPGKSRHRRGRYSPPKKRKKERASRPAVVVPQPVAAQVKEPASPPEVTAQTISVPAPVRKPATVQHPYITGELRTIGILAGIMLIILIVLAVVLP